jgi:hypothetical protein
VVQRQTIQGIPEDAGQQQGTRQAVGPTPSPPIRVRDPQEQDRASDAEEGEGRSGPGLIVPES